MTVKILEDITDKKLNEFEPIPADKLNSVARKQLEIQFKRYSLEERLLALIFHTMQRQLDPIDLKLPYMQKTYSAMRKINGASAYIPEIVEMGNRIWQGAYDEMEVDGVRPDCSIPSFLVSMCFREQKKFKKMGVNIKNLQKLSKISGDQGLTMQTLKLSNLMIKKIYEEVEAKDFRLWIIENNQRYANTN